MTDAIRPNIETAPPTSLVDEHMKRKDCEQHVLRLADAVRWLWRDGGYAGADHLDKLPSSVAETVAECTRS